MGDSSPYVYQQDGTPILEQYSGVALSYGTANPYQQPLHSSTSESLTTPYPQTDPFPSVEPKEEVVESLTVDASGFSWQFVGPETPFPYGVAIRAGRDADGSAIFVGRAFHEGDMIPAKVHPERRVAYICYNGEEVPKYEYEILRSGDFVWEFVSNGVAPANAVQCGKTIDGEPLYMGRCLYRGTQTPGKFHPSHGCLYIPFNGEEVVINDYEILVLK